MNETEQQLFEARRARFAAMARKASYAVRLGGASVINDGHDHETTTMIARSKRAVNRIMTGLFEASLQMVRR